MIKFSIPVSIRDRNVQMEFDDGTIALQIGQKKVWWYIRPPRERGPIDRAQMRLPGMMHNGVYASMVHRSTVSWKKNNQEDF